MTCLMRPQLPLQPDLTISFSYSPPHVGRTFGLSFAKLFLLSGLSFLFFSILRCLCKQPFFQSSFPELCVQAITMFHRLCDPLCSNNHNCDLIMVCVAIWQNFIKAETLIISCSSWKPQYLAQSWHIYTQKYLSQGKKWMNKSSSKANSLRWRWGSQSQWRKWCTMGNLLQVSYKVETQN